MHPDKLFALLIRHFRLKRGILQRDLGSTLGLDQAQVSRIEMGLRPVTAHEWEVITETLGIPYIRSAELHRMFTETIRPTESASPYLSPTTVRRRKFD